MGLEDLMKEITRETESIVDTKTLIGEPVTSGGKTVMPIIRVSAGFGSAGGERDTQTDRTSFVAGGYAGVNMEPIGFIVMSKGDVRLLTVSGRHTFSRVVDMVPEVISKVKEGAEVSERKPEAERTYSGSQPFGEKGESPEGGHREFSSRSIPEGGAGGGGQATAGRAGAEARFREETTQGESHPEEGHREFSSRSIPEGGAGGGSQATAGRAGAEARFREETAQGESHPEEGHREFSSRSIPEGGAGGGSQATAGRAGAESSRSRRRGSTRDETEC